jgi:rhamnogalacturonan endolyase
MTISLLTLITSLLFGTRNMEWLDRGLIAVSTGTNKTYLSWRLLAPEMDSVSGFNVYRNGTRITATPITTSTNYTDAASVAGATYTVRAIKNGVEGSDSPAAKIWPHQWLSIPLTPPAVETMPDGTTCTYSANDASTADLDGDGQYEIILKWDPSNAKDNSQSGYTGDVFLDAYKLNGTRLWRIDLGPNIRAGAHYTQFQVYDYDGDGKAELIVKTAPGTKDASGAYLTTGTAVGATNATDYRNTSGYILTGPEWLTLFDGQTGKELNTVNYNPARGTVSTWGDAYGNRVDRFLAYTAWLDGVHPTAVFQRGYYTRLTMAAWNVVNKKLVQQWFYDRALPSGEDGQGNHNGSVGDILGDGKDEIFTGSTAIKSDGTLMWDNGWGHGDAMHLGAMDPSRGGKQIWAVKEGRTTSVLCDAKTGDTLWTIPGTSDVGRGMAADIDSTHPGYEVWSAESGGTFDIKGNKISTAVPADNFRIYWDGDLYDEILDDTKLDKWTGNGTTRLISFYNYPAGDGVVSNNGTKATPALVADLFGDWREEAVYRTTNSDSLVIFTTTIPTPFRMYTLMHDPQYRASVAWQNSAYNQPPHLGFWLAAGMAKVPRPDIHLVGQPATTGLDGNHVGVLRAKAPTLSWMEGTSAALPEGYAPGTGFEVRDLAGRILARGSSSVDGIELDHPVTRGVHILVPTDR